MCIRDSENLGRAARAKRIRKILPTATLEQNAVPPADGELATTISFKEKGQSPSAKSTGRAKVLNDITNIQITESYLQLGSKKIANTLDNGQISQYFGKENLPVNQVAVSPSPRNTAGGETFDDAVRKHLSSAQTVARDTNDCATDGKLNTKLASNSTKEKINIVTNELDASPSRKANQVMNVRSLLLSDHVNQTAITSSANIDLTHQCYITNHACPDYLGVLSHMIARCDYELDADLQMKVWQDIHMHNHINTRLLEKSV